MKLTTEAIDKIIADYHRGITSEGTEDIICWHESGCDNQVILAILDWIEEFYHQEYV